MSVNTSRSISDISDTQEHRLVGHSPINENSVIDLDIDDEDECFEDKNGRHQEYFSEGEGEGSVGGVRD
jgi:hypothetical protein